NETIGFLAAESGSGYTWTRNSREHRLTPWSNDPIADPHDEALYVRDEESGAFWSPLPGPAPPPAPFEVRHGFGYSMWRHSSHGLDQELTLFVPREDPVKIARLRIGSDGAGTRRLSLFSFQRLVLGVVAADGSRSVATEIDESAGVILAENPLGGDFRSGVVFAAAVTPASAGRVRFGADRASFLGRNGSAESPAALHEAELDGRAGGALDPCAAIQVPVTVPAGGAVECAFLLGEAPGRDAALSLVSRYRRPAALDAAAGESRAFWQETLAAVEVETPVPEIDLVLNGWLLYQCLCCRLWARSAFYQSGGAFGFRDQLQDAAGLVYARPDLTRAQILLHAGHQFVEGDVLHWWHPPASRGTRTRFSDDLLWLPYVTAFYVRTTGDRTILDERVGFRAARLLEPGEDEAYLATAPAAEAADLYEHCCRSLDRSLTRGAHGLPLMGTGDWNDGMNRVGREGRGESVWLGFFLCFVIDRFLPICEGRGDGERSRRYREYRSELQKALDEAGWDGEWYRRAYYDDGTPLGSAANDECRIDALAQAWAVISGAVARERASGAMDAVEKELVSDEHGLIRLLAPPFDHTPEDPGYIKGYVAGIRENGGQYTHAALWVVRALAELGRRERAAKLLGMLSPVSHARTGEDVATYRVEPYVVAADVYGAEPHVGRGGWTWYTGAAAWMYRVALESVLGFTIEGGATLRLAPRVPDEWPSFRIRYRLPDGATRYDVLVENQDGRAKAVCEAQVDGVPAAVRDGAAFVPLVRDGATHQVVVRLGARPR
ncbi:MAG: GH36-type glycosyl hydrolase domain-containing protein, partial [Candidatus Binatia bacterium]